MTFLGGYKYVLDFLVIAVLVGASALGIHKYNSYQQDVGAARVQAQWTAQRLVDAQAAADLKAQYQKEKDDALAQNAKNLQTIAVAADAARKSSGVLDGTLKALLADSAIGDLAANRQYTAALAAVFSDCKDKYTEMGRAADGHAADSLMLQQAWPTAPTH